MGKAFLLPIVLRVCAGEKVIIPIKHPWAPPLTSALSPSSEKKPISVFFMFLFQFLTLLRQRGSVHVNSVWRVIELPVEKTCCHFFCNSLPATCLSGGQLCCWNSRRSLRCPGSPTVMDANVWVVCGFLLLPARCRPRGPCLSCSV